MTDADGNRGLYRKYEVNRLNDTAGKHEGCTYFVLDEKHDKFTGTALLAYADACEAEFPQLAADLRARWGNPPASVLMPDVAHALATLWGCLNSGNVDGGGIALRLIEQTLRAQAQGGGWILTSKRVPDRDIRVRAVYRSFGGPIMILARFELGEDHGEAEDGWRADGGVWYRKSDVYAWSPVGVLPSPPEAR